MSPVPRMAMRSIGMPLDSHASRRGNAAADRRSNDAQLVHELGKLLGKERLRAVGHGLVGVGVHLDQQAIGTGSYRGARHRRNDVAEADAVRRIAEMGRCVSFLMTGMAEMSMVLRV